MVETTPPNPSDPGHEVRTYFVRNRNALLARADFGAMFVDYLHLGANQIRIEPEHDAVSTAETRHRPPDRRNTSGLDS